MSLNVKGLLDFISTYTHENSAYWFGTIAGVNKANTTTLNNKKKQYPAHYTENRMARYLSDIQTGKKITDCSGLIKGYLMQGKYNATYDMNDKAMIDRASEKGSIDTIPEIPGLGLWKSGHVAVYLGNGRYKEAAGFSAGIREGNNMKQFKKWFKIPYIEYTSNTTPAPAYDVHALALRTIRGEFGNGAARRRALNNLGYGDIYDKVQAEVNRILRGH